MMFIENEIRKFVEDTFLLDGEDHLGDEDSLLEGGVIDSTGVLELVALIEEKYDFKIKDEEITPENLDSIQSISRFIQGKLNLSHKALEGKGGMD